MFLLISSSISFCASASFGSAFISLLYLSISFFFLAI
jgi:hypothetical protein